MTNKKRSYQSNLKTINISSDVHLELTALARANHINMGRWVSEVLRKEMRAYNKWNEKREGGFPGGLEIS